MTQYDACTDVKKDDNMAHYPKNLPTLFIHSKNDPLCDVKGPRDIMNKYFKDNRNVEFIELDGSVHCLTVPQSLSIIKPYLKEVAGQTHMMSSLCFNIVVADRIGTMC